MYIQGRKTASLSISEMGFDHITAGMDINIQNLNIELKELYTKRSDILKKRNSNASQNVRNRKDYARSLFDAFA